MPARHLHSVNTPLTAEVRVRHGTIRAQIEQEKATLTAQGRRAKARHTMRHETVEKQ